MPKKGVRCLKIASEEFNSKLYQRWWRRTQRACGYSDTYRLLVRRVTLASTASPRTTSTSHMRSRRHDTTHPKVTVEPHAQLVYTALPHSQRIRNLSVMRRTPVLIFLLCCEQQIKKKKPCKFAARAIMLKWFAFWNFSYCGKSENIRFMKCSKNCFFFRFMFQIPSENMVARRLCNYAIETLPQCSGDSDTF